MCRGWVTGLVFAGWLAGCGHVSPPVPAPATPEDEVSLEGGFLTVHVAVPAGPAGRKPAVIAPRADHEALLAAGIVAASYHVHWEFLRAFAPPEPPATEKRVGVWLLASPTPKTIGKSYLTFVAYDANEAIPKVLDYLSTLPDVDPARTGISGTSTSGFAALQAIAADRRPVGATVVSACGDYHRFLHLSNLAMNGHPLDLDPAYDAWLRTQEPIRHPERLVHATLLMVNGADDRAVPLPCAEATAQTLRRAYARQRASRRFRFVVVPGVGHVPDARAADEVTRWWRRVLAPG
jgi:dienelactone hydrolase